MTEGQSEPQQQTAPEEQAAEQFDPNNIDDVARWAAAVTVSADGPIQDGDDVTKYFATYQKAAYYASVANQSTSLLIEQHTGFHWKCCIRAEELSGVTTGKVYVGLVRDHLITKDPADEAHTPEVAGFTSWFE